MTGFWFQAGTGDPAAIQYAVDRLRHDELGDAYEQAALRLSTPDLSASTVAMAATHADKSERWGSVRYAVTPRFALATPADVARVWVGGAEIL